MKKLLTVTAALFLFLGFVVSVPVPVQATIGVEVAGSTDASGLYYEAKWLDGNWSEFYSIGDSYWGTWIEEGTAETPGTETGDFYSYAYMDSGAGVTSYQWESDLDGITKSEDWTKNSTTGYSLYDLEYNALSLDDPTVAYYEQLQTEDDPVSGYSNYYYYREVDFDGDHNGDDDWKYSEWKVNDVGTGYTRDGHQLYNYVDGIREYDDKDANTLTGYYDIDQDYYKDTDMDRNWTDNYYTYYDESYDPYDGEYYTSYQEVDRSAVMHDAATYYSYFYDENKITGSFYTYTNAQVDTDGDGSYDDWGTSNPGAYRTYSEAGYDVNLQDSWSYSQLYDSINMVYMQDSAHSYASGAYYTSHQYAKDTDGDGYIETGGWDYGYDDFWNATYSSYNANYGSFMESNWTSDDLSNNSGNYWYTSFNNGSTDAGSYWKDAQAASVIGYVYTSTGYDADDGYSWSEQEAKTWGVDYVASGSWSYDAGDSGTWANKHWDTDGNTDWNNTWDYEVYSYTWDETNNGSHAVGYSLDDYDNGNYFDYQTISSASWYVVTWDNDLATAGYENQGTFASVSEGAAPYAGVSEWWYDTPAPNYYEKYLYSGDTGDWYLMYYY